MKQLKGKLRVLWFSNVPIARDMKGSGTWLVSMANALTKYHPEVEIYNVTEGGERRVDEKVNGICQITLPLLKNNKGKKWKQREKECLDIVREVNPNIIHVWGTEKYWGCLDFCGSFPSIPVLLEMQGIVKSVADAYCGELSISEIVRAITLKELLKPTSHIYFIQKKYRQKAIREVDIVKHFYFISVQSQWVEKWIKYYNPSSVVFRTGILLRSSFYSVNQWSDDNIKSHVIFTTAATQSPLKGLHVLLKAFSVVRKIFPDAKLRIAGSLQNGIKGGGYFNNIIKPYIKDNGLTNDVVFLGALSTDQLINEYKNASVFVNPSFVESYSLVVAEAMMVGTPTVASYAGAIPELGKNQEELLLFPKGDYVACAHAICDLMADAKKSRDISLNSRKIALVRNDEQNVVDRQVEIYTQLLKINNQTGNNS